MASLGYSPIVRPTVLSDEPVYEAWAEYTGVPEALGGGAGFVIGQGLLQGLQAKGTMRLGLPGYPTTFGAAFRAEFILGTIFMATALTFIDPEHKIEGWGLDETRFYQEHLEGTWTNLKASAIAVAKQDVPLTKKWM
jgi:hypothetical protein